MYCVIGTKVLRCEVREECVGYSWCRIGTAEQNTSIPHNKLFETEKEAKVYIKERDRKKADFVDDISKEVEKCNALYKAFQEETGITVRVIDRKWTSTEVTRQLSKLKKKQQSQK